jgi:hypothetical protein
MSSEQLTDDPRDTLIEQLTKTLEATNAAIGAMQSQIDDMKAAPSPGLHTISNQSAPLEPGELFNERIASLSKKQQYAFNPGDIVMLASDTDKCKLVVASLSKTASRDSTQKLLAVIEEGGGLPGRVITWKQNNRNGEQKFQVQFEGVGKDSCLESELSLLRRVT